MIMRKVFTPEILFWHLKPGVFATITGILGGLVTNFFSGSDTENEKTILLLSFLTMALATYLWFERSKIENHFNKIRIQDKANISVETAWNSACDLGLKKKRLMTGMLYVLFLSFFLNLYYVFHDNFKKNKTVSTDELLIKINEINRKLDYQRCSQ